VGVLDQSRTWVRFSPKGTNLLGENHEQVTLQDDLRRSASTSFIFEPFLTDLLTPWIGHASGLRPRDQ
jgi:hypothetical protein